ncbi:MAG TPA: ATP-binding protein [Calidithermus sp.]|nr:ATP-binding protein [Calidithermus sp.]
MSPGPGDPVDPRAIVAARRPPTTLFRLLERDERVFAVLLAVAMVGGLATLGLVPLRPRHRIDLTSLVFWFGAYKLGIFALVTATPRATRAIFLGALGVDLVLVFLLLALTGGGDSLFYLLFFPLVAVNAYYFGPWVGLAAALIAGGLYALSAWLMPPWVGWTPAVILSALVGLPAVTLGLVAERERRARGEVERLNRELTGTLSRLQAAQDELLVAERMATVGRLSLKVAHEVRNPISAIELNAEMLQDIVRSPSAVELGEAAGLVAAIRDQVRALDALTEEYLAFARFPRPHFEEDSVNDLVVELAEFIRPVAVRQGLTLRVDTDPAVPLMDFDRPLLRQAVLNLVKNGLEALSQGGQLTLATRREADAVEISVADTGGGIPEDVGRRLFEPFFTTKPQGTGLGLSIARQIAEEHGGEIRWTSTPGAGARFTIRLPLRRPAVAARG